MADFGGDNPFASGSTEKNAADKKNEEKNATFWFIKHENRNNLV